MEKEKIRQVDKRNQINLTFTENKKY